MGLTSPPPSFGTRIVRNESKMFKEAIKIKAMNSPLRCSDLVAKRFDQNFMEPRDRGWVAFADL